LARKAVRIALEIAPGTGSQGFLAILQISGFYKWFLQVGATKSFAEVSSYGDRRGCSGQASIHLAAGWSV
jgi:hypothetical protein